MAMMAVMQYSNYVYRSKSRDNCTCTASGLYRFGLTPFRIYMNVLIVEPSKFVATVLSNLCAKHGLIPHIADSGKDGLDKLRLESTDLILMSYELRDMKGPEFFSHAKTIRKARGVVGVMFSGTVHHDVMSEALEAGITECFAKNDISRLEDFLEQFAASASVRFSGCVMLVEDSKTAAMFACSILEEMGLQVQVYITAEQAIEAFGRGSYDLVITDYVLAGSLSGLAVIRAVRQSPGRKAITPILAMSSLVDTTRKVEILRNGANDFVFKPVVAEELRARVGNLLTTQILMRRLEAQSQAMKDMAMRDQLTGLHNRHHLQAELPQQFIEADQQGKQPSLIIIDIDHFKQVNDTHGHDVGDMVLVEVASALSEAATQKDILARLGGEEFVLLVQEDTLDAALARADSIRRTIETRNPAGIPLTVSLGVAKRKPGEIYKALFCRADEAVYRAKAGGRNRVEANVDLGGD